MTNYLHSLDQHTLRGEVVASLPRAAEEGTLRDRMRNTPAADHVRAKTGSLFRFPSRKPLQDSLAGYCQSDTTSLAFTMIYERAETRYAARASLDRVVSGLATGFQ